MRGCPGVIGGTVHPTDTPRSSSHSLKVPKVGTQLLGLRLDLNLTFSTRMPFFKVRVIFSKRQIRVKFYTTVDSLKLNDRSYSHGTEQALV